MCLFFAAQLESKILRLVFNPGGNFWMSVRPVIDRNHVVALLRIKVTAKSLSDVSQRNFCLCEPASRCLSPMQPPTCHSKAIWNSVHHCSRLLTDHLSGKLWACATAATDM